MSCLNVASIYENILPKAHCQKFKDLLVLCVEYEWNS